MTLDSETTELYKLLYSGGWTLLAFTGAGRAADFALEAELHVLGRPDISSYIVSTSARLEAAIPVLYDLDEVAYRAYQVELPTVYLIRPDGHAGARVSPKELRKLAEYANQWIPTRGLSAATGQKPTMKTGEAVPRQSLSLAGHSFPSDEQRHMCRHVR